MDENFRKLARQILDDPKSTAEDLFRKLLYLYFKQLGLIMPSMNGALKTPFGYLVAAMIRQTQRFDAKGGSGTDIDLILEKSGTMVGVEFKNHGQNVGFGQFEVFRRLTERPSTHFFVAYLDSIGEIVRYSIINQGTVLEDLKIYPTKTSEFLSIVDKLIPGVSKRMSLPSLGDELSIEDRILSRSSRIG